jgi:anti-sigma B factor antagonist
MVEGLEIVVLRDGDRTTLVLNGELDLYSANVVHRVVAELLDDPTQEIVLDLTDLTFLDAVGVSPLVRLANAVEQAGSRVTARSAKPMPALLIAMTPIQLAGSLLV